MQALSDRERAATSQHASELTAITEQAQAMVCTALCPLAPRAALLPGEQRPSLPDVVPTAQLASQAGSISQLDAQLLAAKQELRDVRQEV